MSIMEHKESYERFDEGLARAISCMKEMAVLTGVKDWTKIAGELQHTRLTGKKFYDSRPLTDLRVKEITEARAAEAKIN